MLGPNFGWGSGRRAVGGDGETVGDDGDWWAAGFQNIAHFLGQKNSLAFFGDILVNQKNIPILLMFQYIE